MKWKDVTSYSRNGDRTPRSWQSSAGELKIVVTKYTGYGDAWTLTCIPFFNIHVLTSVDIELAKREAATLIKAEFEDCLKGLKE